MNDKRFGERLLLRLIRTAASFIELNLSQKYESYEYANGIQLNNIDTPINIFILASQLQPVSVLTS